MPRTLPLFPLPLVLLPGQSLPLHVFEPRYRAMLAYAEAHDGEIAMATLRSPADAALEEAEVHPLVGVGKILGTQALEDGRSNVLLRFVRRAQIVEVELTEAGFRLGATEALPALEGPVPQAPWIRALLAQLGANSATARSSFSKLARRDEVDMLHVIADLVLTTPSDRIQFLGATSQSVRGELVQRRLAERVASTLEPAGEA